MARYKCMEEVIEHEVRLTDEEVNELIILISYNIAQFRQEIYHSSDVARIDKFKTVIRTLTSAKNKLKESRPIS